MISYPKRYLVLRLVAVVAVCLFIAGSGKPIFEIEGLGDFTLASLSEWGARLLRITGYAAIVAWALLPLRWATMLSGCLVGGVAMLAVTLGKDTIDLAMMDENVSSAMDLIHLLSGGKLMVVGLCILSLSSLLTACLWDKKIPSRSPVGDSSE